MQSFWNQLPRPFFALAPMEDVTDAAFRRMFARHGKPDVLWSEFTSADGLMRAPEKGRQKLLRKLLFAPEERPIVAQFFSADPKAMEYAAGLAADLGFDGIDINMGCPDRAVEKQGAGASLIKNPGLARELIVAAHRGARGLPVSVKTRIGYNTDVLDEWLPILLEMNLAAVTIHARTRKEMSDVPAQWETIARAVEIRNKLAPATVILGNGDVKTMAEGREKASETGCDGIMIGRGAFGNPWFFAEHIASSDERIAGLIEHLELFENLLGDTTHYATMKKHFKAYLSGFDHAKELREKLMATNTASEAVQVLRRG